MRLSIATNPLEVVMAPRKRSRTERGEWRRRESNPRKVPVAP
jgi:hypothetical protein